MTWLQVLSATALGAVISALVSSTVTLINSWRERKHRTRESSQRAEWEKELARLRTEAETSLQALRRGWDLEDRHRNLRREQKSEARNLLAKWIVVMQNGARTSSPTGAEREIVTHTNSELQLRLPSHLIRLQKDFQLLWVDWIVNKPLEHPDDIPSFPPTEVTDAYDKFLSAVTSWLHEDNERFTTPP